MAGQLKLNGTTVATESNGSVQLVNTKIQLNQNDDTIIDSLGNSVISESSGQVTFDSVTISNSSLANSALENSTIKLSSSGITIQDSNGNSLIEESNGVVTIGGNSTIVIGENTTIPSISGGMPPGCIMSFGMGTPPAGWIVCNGASYSTSSYQELYNAIGYTWGGSGGSFNVPDLRGEFLRGWANGTSNDPDAANRNGGDNVGSSQSYAMRKIYAQWGGTRRYDGGIPYSGVTWTANWEGGYGASDRGFTNVTFDTSHSNFAMNTSDFEARPRNKNVQYCIKY